MIEEAIVESAAEPILLDGFPRSVAQACALDSTLASHARELAAVVLIDVSDGVAAARISTRAEGRKDDRPETVRERLRVYHEETEPLIDYYETRGILMRVDGARTPDAVTYGIRRVLEPVVAVRLTGDRLGSSRTGPS